MLELVVFLVVTGVLPVLVNKSTESGRFDWIKPYLRESWTGVFGLFSLYLLQKPAALGVVMGLHQQLHERAWVGYLLSGACGALLLCGYWWFAGKMFSEQQPPQPPVAAPPQVPANARPTSAEPVLAEPHTGRLGGGSVPAPVPLPDQDFENRVQVRTTELIRRAEALIGQENKLYLDIIGDPNQMEHLGSYQKRIEDLRSAVGDFYNKELQGSGATSLALPHSGILGKGPIAFELKRLENGMEAQKRIVADMEKYVRRRFSIESHPTLLQQSSTQTTSPPAIPPPQQGLQDSVSLQRTPESGSLNARLRMIQTEGKNDRLVSLGVRPVKILIEPSGAVLTARDLPQDIRLDASTTITVKGFTSDGIVLDEGESRGKEIRITVLDAEPVPPPNIQVSPAEPRSETPIRSSSQLARKEGIRIRLDGFSAEGRQLLDRGTVDQMFAMASPAPQLEWLRLEEWPQEVDAWAERVREFLRRALPAEEEDFMNRENAESMAVALQHQLEKLKEIRSRI